MSELFSLSRPFDAMSVLILGLLLLMLTPILRVLTTIVGFVTEKDWTFTAISLTVFLMLLGELVYSLR